MTKRILLLLLVLASVFASTTRHVDAAGTVSVTAWRCADGIDPASTDAAAFASACADEAVNSAFALTAGEVTRRRTTSAGKAASWTAVSGPFTLKYDNLTGQSSVVFCAEGSAPEAKVESQNDTVEGTLAGNDGISCRWYLLPASSPSPTPTATVAPTQTTGAPTATVASTQAAGPPTATAVATATPRTTATPAGTGEDATATPGELPPLPESDDPPTMFRSDPARTGEQPGPAPEGDPILLWRYPIGDRPISSPVLAGDTLYVGGDDGLLAIWAATGTQRWLYPMSRQVLASPAVVEGLVYVGSEDGLFVCLDARTGVERWRLETGGMILSSPLVEDGLVYFTSYDGYLYALDTGTGERVWRTRLEGTEYIPGPAFWEGVIIAATGDIDGGYLYGFDAKTGEMLWEHQVAGSIGSTPTLVDGVAYFGSDDGYFYAFDINEQERVFRQNTGKLVRSSAAVFGGLAYIGNRIGFVYAYDIASGELRWEFDAGDWVDSPPSYLGDRIYVGSKHRKLFVLNAADASIVWEFEMGASITTAPIVVNGTVYFAARDGFLYAIGGTDSLSQNDLELLNGVRPPNIPKEITIGDERFLFDRMVIPNLDELDRIDRTGTMSVFRRPEPGTSDAVYVQIEDRLEEGEEADTEFARYIPEYVGIDGASCLAEAERQAAAIRSGEVTFAFAGAEPDIAINPSMEVASSDSLGSIYAEDANPQPERLFIVAEDVVQRYELLDGNGLPEQLRGTLPFGGQIYRFDEVDSQTDLGSLTKIGCAGPFAIQAPADAGDGPPDRIFAVVDDQLMAFVAVVEVASESSRLPDSSDESENMVVASLPERQHFLAA